MEGGQVTQKERLIVALFKEGLSIADIVKQSGVDPKAVEVALRLALNGGK